MSLGTQLRSLRLARGLTQTRLAELVGTMNAAFVSDIETGKSMPSYATFIALAQALEVDLNTLADIEGSNARAAKHPAITALRNLDIDELNPLDALNALYNLKRMLK